MQKNIVHELERLVENSTKKRLMLLQIAVSKSKMKKRLTISSGVLALLSAGTITTVIIKYLGNETLQIIAAVTAAISGVISLILTAYYSEEDTSKIYEGSAKYLLLRDKSYRLLIHPNISNEDAFNSLESLQGDYALFDETYSKYYQYAIRAEWHGQSAPPLNYKEYRVKKSVDMENVSKEINMEMENFNREVSKLNKKS